MKEIMLQFFPNLEACIETHLQSFGVKDEQTDEKPAFTVMLTLEEMDYFKNADFPKPTHLDFLVENNTKQNVHFVAIDACLLHKEMGGQCDFAIFDEKTFAFVDIKDVKTNQRRYVKEKAISQLKNTFDIFMAKGISFEKQEMYAIIGFTFQQSYTQSHPKAKSNRAADLLFFEDNYKATLLEINTFEFR